MEDVRHKIKAAIVTLYFWCMPPIPCETRWLTCLGCSGWWLLGCLVHGLCIAGYAAAWGKAGQVLRIDGLGNFADAAGAGVHAEQPDDDNKTRLGKRLRRGARFLSNAKHLLVWPLHSQY